MSLELHRPDGKGGIESRPPEVRDWRSQLRSPRWGSGLRRGRLRRFDNPEMNPTPTALSIVFWGFLGLLTFVLLVLGYGTNFWHFPAN
ncbi:MAG: hypothetical protein ACHQ3P_11825 [Candidatus Limnocylindrales bacterium]